MSSKKYWINLALLFSGIGIILLYSICGESCSYVKGSIFSIDLKYLGLLYITLLSIFNIMRKSTILLILLSFGLGAEMYLTGLQIRNEIICYYCVIFGGVILTLFLLNFDMSKKFFICASLLVGFIFFLIFLESSIIPLHAEEVLVPFFGNGKTTVRLYTDYFCGPCNKMEPRLETLIIDLVKSGKINITFVDTPIHTYSSLYARYFLYILNEKNEFDYALKARNVLFEAAKNNITKEEMIEDFLKKKNVKFRPFNVSITFNILNDYIREDKINATPTCVIINGGRKSYTGSADIIKALQEIK